MYYERISASSKSSLEATTLLVGMVAIFVLEPLSDPTLLGDNNQYRYIWPTYLTLEVLRS